MNKVLVISFDAVGDKEFDRLLQYPNFNKLMRKSAVVREADTIFLSNTYPIHASVTTGVLPSAHGIISNTEPFPKKDKQWYSAAKRFRRETIWQAAHKAGLETAAVMWPVTAGAKEIKYNVPEVMAKSGENQIVVSLKAGSKGLQIKEFLKHRKKLKGLSQPELDDFSTSCMVDIIEKHHPDLMLMHLTAYDTLCHIHGKFASAMEQAYQSLDRNLRRLLEVIEKGTSVIVFSDHSQLNVRTNLAPNELLVKEGLLEKKGDTYVKGSYGCFIECCGGSAFFYPGMLPDKLITRVKQKLEQSEGFGRFLREDEMKSCGRKKLPFGFCAEKGYSYAGLESKEKANHGYPLDYEDYKIFYMINGPQMEAGTVVRGGSILELTGHVNRLLGLQMEHPGKARTELYK